MKSLKIRFAATISLLVVIILVVNAAATLVVRNRQMRREIVDSGVSFSQLTVAPLCQGYELYYASGYYKFREIVSNLMSMNRYVDRIQILDIGGEVKFDTRDLESGAMLDRPRPRLDDPSLVERIKRLDISWQEVTLEDGARRLEIVTPYVEEWGRHRLSVRYLASFDALVQLFRNTLIQVVLLTMVFVLLGAGLAYAAARQITEPISRLTVAAREMGRGQLEQEVAVRGDDEIGELAQNFNQMAMQLKENLEALAESYEQLSQANLELRKLDQLKSEFIANISHELRTPLTAIAGYADYLAMEKLGPLTDTQHNGLEVMRRNIRRLMRQIKELLDFTTIEAGHLAVEVRPFELKPLLDEVVDSLHTELEKKKLWIKLEAPEGVRVQADRERIGQVMDNLIINAVKFTSQGGVTIRAVPQGDDGIRVTVSDTGIGIPPDSIHKVFERFQQLDGSSTRRYGGVGLGLAIVKSILDAHRIAIEVKSVLGQGTEFIFDLPLAKG
jgi:signal transduction histidine kinase